MLWSAEDNAVVVTGNGRQQSVIVSRITQEQKQTSKHQLSVQCKQHSFLAHSRSAVRFTFVTCHSEGCLWVLCLINVDEHRP